MERGHELRLLYEAVLKREQSEEEMAVGCDSSHRTSLHASEAARLRSIPGNGFPRAAGAPHWIDYLTTDHRSQPVRADCALGASLESRSESTVYASNPLQQAQFASSVRSISDRYGLGTAGGAAGNQPASLRFVTH